jgi:hypothetical protein
MHGRPELSVPSKKVSGRDQVLLEQPSRPRLFERTVLFFVTKVVAKKLRAYLCFIRIESEYISGSRAPAVMIDEETTLIFHCHELIKPWESELNS